MIAALEALRHPKAFLIAMSVSLATAGVPVAQGLKLNLFWISCGTTEVVPFPIEMIASFLNPNLMFRLWRRGSWGGFV